MFKNIVLPAGLLAGTIIGAGVFALPFVFEKAGILSGLFYLAIFSVVFILIHLMYADVILRTEGVHRFAGYAEIYLGRLGRYLAILMTVIGMIFVLTVYLILAISFINLIFPTLPDIYKLLVFWLLASLTVFWKVKKLTFSEFLISIGIPIIILIIFIYGLKNFEQLMTATIFNPAFIFLPYGIVLFSLSGRVAIPLMVDYFKESNRPVINIKTAIILGTLMPALLYLLFVFGVLNLSGTVSEDSLTGLVGHLPLGLLWLLGILGIISLWSTYIVIGQDVKKSLEYDLKFPKFLPQLTVISLPIILYFSGFQSFLKLVELTGGIFIGLEGIFIILMRQRAAKIIGPAPEVAIKKLNPLISYFLLLIFALGIIYVIIY